MKKRTGWAILASVLLLSGCYQHAHVSTRIGEFGYQFDVPRDYCPTHGEPPDFEMDCPNGTITVEFVHLDGGDTAESIMVEAIDENPGDCEYSPSELQGIHSTITLAELSNNTREGNACPVVTAQPDGAAQG